MLTAAACDALRLLQENKGKSGFGKACKEEVKRYEQQAASDYRLNHRWGCETGGWGGLGRAGRAGRAGGGGRVASGKPQGPDAGRRVGACLVVEPPTPASQP